MLARINWRPSPSELRYFTNTLAVAAVVLGALLAFCGRVNAALILGVALLSLATLCRFVPALGRWVYLVWMAVTFVLSLVVSPIVIGIIYYIVLTPFALIARLTGKDELRRKRHPRAETYFTKADHDASSESFTRQF